MCRTECSSPRETARRVIHHRVARERLGWCGCARPCLKIEILHVRVRVAFVEPPKLPIETASHEHVATPDGVTMLVQGRVFEWRMPGLAAYDTTSGQIAATFNSGKEA